jgi:hypothetical protein
MNEELRAITKNQRSLDSAVMMSSLIPSEKYSCSGSPLILVKGSTAMAGRSGSGNTGRDGSWIPSDGRSAARCLLVVVGWRVHGADEAQTLAGDGPDQLLLPTIVADRGSRRIDTAGQRRF